MPTTTAAPQNPAAKTAPAASQNALIVQPYLMFDGRCDEAIEFYRRALGAEVVMLMRFKDAPPSADNGNCTMPPGTENKVMHATIRIGATEIFASDGQCAGKLKFEGISL